MLSSKTIRTASLFGLAVLSLAWPAAAQPIRVVSEFTRIGPDGEVVSLDRGERVREILSPATARNAYATYRVVVAAPPGVPYTINIAQNPDNACDFRLYQEIYARVEGEWVPDELKLQTLPVAATLAESQAVQTYLLDLFVPPTVSDARFRLEVQLHIDGHWFIYPMEIRPRPIAAPRRIEAAGPLPNVGARADAPIAALLREALCGEKPTLEPVTALTARALLMRNVRQDIAIGELRMKNESFDGVAGMLLQAAGWKPAPKDFCASAPALGPKGPEWWLRARNYLYQGLPVY